MSSERRNVSAVWQHFEKTSEKQVKCKRCNTVLAFSGSSTSSMNYHLKKHNISSPTDDDPDNPDAPPKQRKLDNMGFTAGRTCDSTRKAAINQLLAKMISMHNLPIHMVEWEYFREFLKFVEPNFTPPCYETVKGLIDDQATKVKSNIRKKMEVAQNVCLTTDVWTSNSNDSYLAVTASFVTPEFELKTPVLGTIFLEERHTATYLVEKMQEVVDEWAIGDKLTAIVHDNAANILHVGEELANESTDSSCAAHSLQLCIQEGMGKSDDAHLIASTVNAASRLVGRFNHSPMATMELNRRQLTMHPDREPKKCIQQVKTRWNSVCDQFDRLLELRWPIVAVLTDTNVIKPADRRTLELKEGQWVIIEDILPVLKKLKHANTLLCGEKYSSLSMVYPVLHNLINHHLLCKDGDSDTVLLFKRTVRREIERRFFNPINKIAALATAVDPRFKDLDNFLPLKKTELKSAIRQQVMLNLPQIAPEQLVIDTDEDDFFVAPSSSMRPTSNAPVSAEAECERYWKETTISSKECPLLWWKKNRERFPNIAKLAMKYLGIPATSVASERHFSKAGLIITTKRSRLAPTTAQSLLIVNHNSDYF